MEKIKLKADTREVGKKGANRRLRKDGFIPAILYGKGEKPVALSVGTKEFTHMMKGSAGRNALVELEIGELEIGGKNTKDRVVVMLKDYQTDVIRREITHVDLLKINMKEKVLVKVPIHVVGKAIGLQKGGLVELVRREIEVRCLPDGIPEKIDIDITDLDIGHSLHLKDLTLPAGLEAAPTQGQDLTIVSIVAPREEVVEAPVAAVPAEGAAAPAEGAAAAAGGAPGAAAPAAASASGGKPEAKPGAKGEKK